MPQLKVPDNKRSAGWVTIDLLESAKNKISIFKNVD
jgi:hypothetical protein